MGFFQFEIEFSSSPDNFVELDLHFLLFSLQCLSRTSIAQADSFTSFLSFLLYIVSFVLIFRRFLTFSSTLLKNNCFCIYILSSVSIMDAITFSLR